MNIGIDARFYGSLGKGLGRYTQKLIEHLEVIDIDPDHQYFIFLRRENFDEYQPSRTNFHKVLADYQWYSFAEQLWFPLLLRKYRLDTMHFPHFNVPILYRRKFIVTIHDLILLHFPTQRASTLHPLWYRLKFAAYKLTIRRAILQSRHIMTVSEFTKQDILKHYCINPDKITVAYEAIDAFCTYSSQEQSLDVLHTYGLLLPEHSADTENHAILKPYFLYVGNAYPHKNLERLIDTLDEADMRDMTLVLVGKEDYFYRRLKGRVSKLKMNNICFAGFVPDRELDVLYRFGRAYVFPSLYEGFGLPPLEAMGRGLPVLATHATSLPEVLGDAALYFYPERKDSFKRALRRLWDNEILRKALRAKGYNQASRFEWGAMAERTLRHYE